MQNSDFFVQNDARWRNLVWYDARVSALLKRMTKALHAYVDNPDSGKRLIAVAHELYGHIGDLIERPYRQSVKHAGSLARSGCWHMSIANMLTYFHVRLDGKPCSPTVLLTILRKRLLGTLTGYVEHPFVDPLSLITCGEVQLSHYQDFGKTGADLQEVGVIDILSTTKESHCCGIINVANHEFFGCGDSHYVLVKDIVGDDYEIIDPGWPDNKHLFKAYPLVYQVSIYRKVKLTNRSSRPADALC